MARFDVTLIDPPADELLRCLVEATTASGRGRWRPGRVPMDTGAWRGVLALRAIVGEGVDFYDGPPDDGPTGGFVCIAWWTDALRRRHTRVVGCDSVIRVDEFPHARTWRDLPPLAVVYPNHTVRRTVGADGDPELLAVCACGACGPPGRLNWMGTCCGPCYDHFHEDGVSDAASRPAVVTAPESPLAASADGRLVAFISPAGLVTTWDVRTGNVVPIPIQFVGQVEALAVAPDRSAVAVITSAGIGLWIGGEQRFVPLPAATGAGGRLRFLPDSQHFVYSQWRSHVAMNRLREPDEPFVDLTGHPLVVLDLSASADGRVVACNVQGPLLAVWDVLADQLRTWPSPAERFHYTHTVACSADGRRAALAGIRVAELAEAVAVYRTDTGDLSTWIESPGDVATIAFAPNGESITVVDRTGRGTGFSLMTGKPIAAVAWNVREFGAAAFSADGATLVTAGADGVVKVWPWRELLGA